MIDITPYLAKMTWIGIAAVILLVGELYFGLFINKTKKGYKDNLHAWVVSHKLLSYVLGGATFGLLCLITIYLYYFAWVFGVAAFVAIVYSANYLWAKSKLKSEEEKEYLDRVYANTKFRIGDKVRVRKGIYEGDEIESNSGEYNYEMSEDSQKLSKSQKILVVTDVNKDGDLTIKEADGSVHYNYSDKALKKAGRGKKR